LVSWFSGTDPDGLTGARFIPADHGELLLQRLELTSGGETAAAGTTHAQIQQHRIARVPTTDRDPLLGAVEVRFLQAGDAVRQRSPIGVGDRWGRRESL
jgi:hypothetical protein